MIIWGTRHYQKLLGQSNLVQTCPNCHNEVRYQVMEYGSKFALFFIPLFPISKKYRLVCPICQYGYEISKDEVEKYLA
ncbi:zinc-ribbon domain-containing protein [Vaginisenegalia massiliensis]|uniref:zinc-ribbon domain-containing protein n=1 Tax=Vaginisenegalia massiliensis TaxID=2058294 RepID=UPI000F5223A5|nr:zinc ribbon domain-containing protein [Vaginisenegalia massiliensis]